MRSAAAGYGLRVPLPAPRVLLGMAASILVLGLALAITDADAATSARSHRAEVYVPMPGLPVGVLIDPYTRAAAACPGLDPAILVAIHDVETNRDAHGATSVMGAVGPMQFLPDTWAAYGVDGNGDGHTDAWNLDDALAGATRFLCAHAVMVPSSREDALFEYNHSRAYVRRVLTRVDELRNGVSA